jgi:hypothetical protein
VASLDYTRQGIGLLMFIKDAIRMANPVWHLSGYVCHCYQSRRVGQTLPTQLSPLPRSTPLCGLHNSVFLWIYRPNIYIRICDMLNLQTLYPIAGLSFRRETRRPPLRHLKSILMESFVFVNSMIMCS